MIKMVKELWIIWGMCKGLEIVLSWERCYVVIKHKCNKQTTTWITLVIIKVASQSNTWNQTLKYYNTFGHTNH